LLVVAVLAGWQAALQHPIEHVDELGELVHLHSGESHDEGSLCDALAALTACAAQTMVFSGAHSADYEVPSHSFGVLRIAQPPPFLSQGPTASL
jgi:hypothetical protein